MAQLSRPDWQPNPVLALPALTTASFNVRAQGVATGFEIRYELQSAHIHFRMPSGGLLLPEEEKVASAPTPRPVSRTPVRIVDRYPAAGAASSQALAIRRGLAIDRTAGGGPGLVHMSIFVFELDAGGVPVMPAAAVATVTFGMGV